MTSFIRSSMPSTTTDSNSLLTTSQQRQPNIIRCEKTDTAATWLLGIPSESPVFNGHFPGFPILPGVVQIEWVKNLAQQLMPQGELRDLQRIKFMRLMLPGKQVQLHLSKQTVDDGDRIEFRFFDDAGNFSSGRLVYRHPSA